MMRPFKLRRFAAECKQKHKEETPDVYPAVLAAAPVREPRGPGIRRAPVAVCSAVFCLCVGAAVLFALKPLKPIDTGKNPDFSDSASTPVIEEPSGQAFPVKLKTFLYSGSGLPLTAGFSGQSMSLKYLNLSEQYQQMQGKSGLVYDIKSRKIISITDLLRSKLISDGIIKENETVDFFRYDEEHILFRKEEASYYYGFTDKKLIGLPVDLYGATVSVSKDFTALLLSKTRGEKHGLPVDDVFWVDIDRSEVKNLTKDSGGKYQYDAFFNVFLSPTGKYAVFQIRHPDGSTYQDLSIPHVLYDLKSEKSYVFEGYATSFSEQDRFMFFKNSRGGFKMDCQSGKITALSKGDQPGNSILNSNFYLLDAVSGDHINGEQSLVRITAEDLRTGEKRDLTGMCNAYVIDEQKRYLYYYKDKDKAVRCVDIATGEAYSLNVDEAFLNEVEANRGDWQYRLFYQLYLSDDNTQLLLTYYVQPPHEKQTARPVLTATDYFYSHNNNLDGFYEFVSPYTKEMQFYVGDGFAYVTLMTESDQHLVLIEDYRTKKFYRICYDSMTQLSFSNIASEKTLSSGRTVHDFLRQAAKGRKVPPAEFDLSALVKPNGMMDAGALFKTVRSPKILKAKMAQLSISSNPYTGTVYSTDQKEIAWMADFLIPRDWKDSSEVFSENNDALIPREDNPGHHFVHQIFMTGADKAQFAANAGYLTKNGKTHYFLTTSQMLCFISEQDYSKLNVFIEILKSESSDSVYSNIY